MVPIPNGSDACGRLTNPESCIDNRRMTHLWFSLRIYFVFGLPRNSKEFSLELRKGRSALVLTSKDIEPMILCHRIRKWRYLFQWTESLKVLNIIKAQSSSTFKSKFKARLTRYIINGLQVYCTRTTTAGDGNRQLQFDWRRRQSTFWRK